MEVSTHSLFLLQQLNVQREFGFLCDCTVAIGNVYFKAHRAVLASFSNYFKMIFIHQSSECIKIQPTDIQPDVFSYLLHIMYTGMCPKQPVDQSRLQEGIKFLHAYQLCRQPGDGANDSNQDVVRMSNLYGIQISSQLAGKEGSGTGGAKGGSSGGSSGGGGRRAGTTTATAAAAAGGGGGGPGGVGDRDGRSSSHVGRSHAQMRHLAVGLDGLEGLGLGQDQQQQQRSSTGLHNAAETGDDSDICSRIKQEQVEEEDKEEEPVAAGGGASPSSSPPCGAAGGVGGLPLLCPRCGECCPSPEELRQHLFTHHAADGLIPTGASGLMDRLTPSGGGAEGGGEEEEEEEEEQRGGGGGDRVCLEEALRHSQAIANQLAAELKHGGGGGGSSPPSLPSASSLLHSRKRKMACAVCSVHFSQKSALQEHMYTHTTGRPDRSRYQRYNRLCSQLLHQHHQHNHATYCQGGDTAAQGSSMLEESNRDLLQDNGSSCYSLDSELSQESLEGVAMGGVAVGGVAGL